MRTPDCFRLMPQRFGPSRSPLPLRSEEDMARVFRPLPVPRDALEAQERIAAAEAKRARKAERKR